MAAFVFLKKHNVSAVLKNKLKSHMPLQQQSKKLSTKNFLLDDSLDKILSQADVGHIDKNYCRDSNLHVVANVHVTKYFNTRIVVLFN